MNIIKSGPRIIKDGNRAPLLIAHRGARREAPENTLPAFQRALELKADGIELDVMLTSDKVPIVTHNDDLSILTLHRGYAHLTPFATVKGLDAGSHFNASYVSTPIPTLPEALCAIKDHDVLTIVEIKAQSENKLSAARLVGGIVSESKMRGPVMVSSASPRIIHEIKKQYPNISRALVVAGRVFSFFLSSFFARKEELDSLHLSLNALLPSIVERERRRGRQIFAWTANKPYEFDLCAAMDVDGIITDDISFARRHFEFAG